MKFTAKIKDVARTLDGILRITLESPRLEAEAAIGLMDIDSLDVEIKKHRKKRSLDANAYYWVLLTKLANLLRMSNAELHNKLLSQYGFLEIVDGMMVKVTLPDTDEANKKVMESTMYHLRPKSEPKAGADGIIYRTYEMIRGSSTYNTAEMSRLIDGLIYECKEASMPDHEIASPEERRILKERYGIDA